MDHVQLPIRLPKQLYAYLIPLRHYSLTKKRCGLNEQKLKLLAVTMSLERSQPHLTTVIYAQESTNLQN